MEPPLGGVIVPTCSQGELFEVDSSFIIIIALLVSFCFVSLVCRAVLTLTHFIINLGKCWLHLAANRVVSAGDSVSWTV